MLKDWQESSARLQNPRVLVVGDVMLDRYLCGGVARISPEAPVPVVRVEEEIVRPGGAANVAANVAALGGRCHLLSVAGDDVPQGELISSIARYGVVIDFISDATSRTTEKIRILSGSQQITRVDREGLISESSRTGLKRRFFEIAPDFDVIIISDYAKGVLAEPTELLAYARKLGKITLVDPKQCDPAAYSNAYLLKPNQKEFDILFGAASTASEMAAKAREAMVRLNIDNVVVTRSAQGMLLIPQDGEEIEVPTSAKEVFDVSGAGDSVIAMLSIAIGSGVSLTESVMLANVAAGIAVSRVGTYVVTAADMLHRAARTGHALKVTPLKSLLGHLRSERSRGKKIVFTNGCFDILHPGHVRLLADARRQGDLLVVGVNSDRSVCNLKGEGRPVNTFADRAEVLSALDSVDFVVEFDAPTPIELIKAIQPNVLVKGGDYQPDKIVGADFVSDFGGIVLALPFHEGYSSTNVMRRNAMRRDEVREDKPL